MDENIPSSWAECDFYEVLGVDRDATQPEITSVYRKLAREHHPDANNGAGGDRFAQISAAYDVLGDVEKRARYDTVRDQLRQRNFAHAHSAAESYGGDTPFFFEEGNLDGFEALFGHGLFDPSGFVRNTDRGDVRATLDVAFTDAVCGTTMALTLQLPDRCTACGGAGGSVTGERLTRCAVCHGSGETAAHRTVNVRIPAGVRDGQTLRIANRGRDTATGRGDLLVTVRVGEHPVFARDGDHLRVGIDVPYTTAALGGRVAVPTIDDGSVTVSVPAGSSSGKVLRVRGRGVPGKGDLLAKVRVTVPDHLSERERGLLEQLAA